MSSVFSHESAQYNDAGHLIDEMSSKQHGHFATTSQENMAAFV